MKSSKLLFAVCETYNGCGGSTFIARNCKSDKNEDGSIAAYLQGYRCYLTTGSLIIGAYYLLSEEPIQIIMPDVIFSRESKRKRTSIFGYVIDDVHKSRDYMP